MHEYTLLRTSYHWCKSTKWF